MAPSSDHYPPLQELEELTLERVKVAAQARLSAQILHDAEVRSMYEMAMDTVTLELSSFLYRATLDAADASVLATYPATWWDALKRDLGTWAHLQATERPWHRLAAWWLRRHPIRSHSRILRLEVEDFATFPDNTRVFPKELGRPVLHRAAHVEAAYSEDPWPRIGPDAGPDYGVSE